MKQLYLESAAKSSGTESGKWITRGVLWLTGLVLLAAIAWLLKLVR